MEWKGGESEKKERQREEKGRWQQSERVKELETGPWEPDGPL